MTKKRIKLAVIRDDENTPCPFGLPITFGCRNAGNVIDKMFPIEKLGIHATEEEKKKVAAANARLLTWAVMSSTETPQQCKYAANLFPKKKKVDCDWNDTAAGQSSEGTLLGSPFYSQVFSGIGLDGMFSYPLGYLADSPLSRQVYFSMGIYGTDIDKSEIIKLAIDIIHASIAEKNIVIKSNLNSTLNTKGLRK